MNRQRRELPGQLGLDGLDTPPVPVQAARPARPTQPRSIGYARCPHGKHGRLTGVYYATDCRLVFRDHTIRLGGAVLLCRGSGQPVPERNAIHEG
jgi:hypothetical protein